MIEAVQTFTGFDRYRATQVGFVLDAGEPPYGIVDGAALIEPRRVPGQYVGGSTGVSFRIMKGVSFRVGQQRGSYVSGEERPTPIDQGMVVITDHRLLFRGDKYAREWLFSKLRGVSHSDDGHWTALAVSNRQKIPGILYGAEHAQDVRFRLMLALATFKNTRDEMLRDLTEQWQQLQAEEPKRPV
jgi:hypothetical protein